MYYEKNYDRLGANTDDVVSLNEKIRFPLIIIIIRSKKLNYVHKYV